jgi:hypothetical protein
VVFDRVSVEVCGADWQTITTVEAPYIRGEAVLELPTTFPTADLQQVDRGGSGKEMWGHWPSVSDDPQALVATLREEIVAWSGERRAGRLYRTDWSGNPSESTIGKSFIGYQYADRPFVLNGFTGNSNGFTFNKVSFVQGWNVYAKITQSGNNIRVTTAPSDELFTWRFEAWP